MLKSLTLIAVTLLVGGCSPSAMRFSCNGFEAYRQAVPIEPWIEQLRKGEREINPRSAAQFGPGSKIYHQLQMKLMGAKGGVPMKSGDGRGRTAAQGNPALLMLSGGGQWGAFGSGLLHGLKDRQDAANLRPEPVLITAISTGAMQAVMIGAGDYDALRLGYTPPSADAIIDNNGMLGLVTKGSLGNLKPLRANLEKLLCEDPDSDKGCMRLQKLADSKDRRAIYIGFVEAESGDLFFVDATEIAADGMAGADPAKRRNAQQCIVGVAVASSAMPVFFNQVRINGKTYYDGGLRVSVFEAPFLKLAEDYAKDLPVYVVRNGPTTVLKDAKPDAKADALTAAMRSETIMVNQLELNAMGNVLYTHPSETVYLATADNYENWTPLDPKTDPGPPVDTPTPGKCIRRPGISFDPNFMRCLYAYGYARGRGKSDPWVALKIPSK